MLSLQDREWAAFGITDLFEPKRGSEKNMGALGKGEVPLVSARNVDNGIKAFVEVPGERLRDGHVVTLNNDGDGGAGLAYYQPMRFALDTHVTALSPHEPLSRQSMQFAAAAMSKQRVLFGHGRSISSKRLGSLKVMLPVDDAGEPDWRFMEDYVREREAVQVERCREFLVKRIITIERERESKNTPVTSPSLHGKTWRAFVLSSLGPIASGRDIYAQERKKGNTPYITSGSKDNGIGYFVGNCNETLDSGYIALNRNGAVGIAFYHPYRSLMGNDCRKLHLKDADGNQYVGIFIAVAISKQSECFSYSRKLGTARARVMQILLLADDAGKPDWAYMEAYARELMRTGIERLVAFLDDHAA